MLSTRRMKKIVALPSLIFLLMTIFAGTAGAQTIIDEGSSSELVAPPSPECSADAIVLVQEVSFTDGGSPIDAPVFGVGAGLEVSFDLEDFEELDAGVLEITEIITFDGHTGRELWPEQANERVALEFLLDGDVVATTDFTPDIEDGVNAAWVVANLGQVELEDGADAARIVHFNDGNNNSVVVSSACAEFVDGDDVDADDDADEDDTEELTLAELIERNSGIQGLEGPDGDALAVTGANEIAFAVIALGVITFGVAFKIQSQDPEDLTF